MPVHLDYHFRRVCSWFEASRIKEVTCPCWHLSNLKTSTKWHMNLKKLTKNLNVKWIIELMLFRVSRSPVINCIKVLRQRADSQYFSQTNLTYCYSIIFSHSEERPHIDMTPDVPYVYLVHFVCTVQTLTLSKRVIREALIKHRSFGQCFQSLKTN